MLTEEMEETLRRATDRIIDAKTTEELLAAREAMRKVLDEIGTGVP